MAKTILFASLVLFQGLTAGPTASIHQVHTQDIQHLISTGKPLLILDARTQPYDDLTRIPGAKLLPYNATERQISQTIPSKDTLVVVYCTSTKCPASRYMAERLTRLGYRNINTYQEGIVAWIASGNPIEIDE